MGVWPFGEAVLAPAVCAPASSLHAASSVAAAGAAIAVSAARRRNSRRGTSVIVRVVSLVSFIGKFWLRSVGARRQSFALMIARRIPHLRRDAPDISALGPDGAVGVSLTGAVAPVRKMLLT